MILCMLWRNKYAVVAKRKKKTTTFPEALIGLESEY